MYNIIPTKYMYYMWLIEEHLCECSIELKVPKCKKSVPSLQAGSQQFDSGAIEGPKTGYSPGARIATCC